MNFFKRRQQRLDLIKAYKNVFDTEEGKTVLYDLLKAGHMIKPTYADKVHEADRNEGKRELVLYILTMMETDEKRLVEMMQESQQEEKLYA